MKELRLDPSHYLARHVTGDWGDLDEHDKQANDEAVTDGSRILSAYGTGEKKLYIITEWDRSVTTILRPDEYYTNYALWDAKRPENHKSDRTEAESMSVFTHSATALTSRTVLRGRRASKYGRLRLLGYCRISL
jgi:hypothetical protein